MNDEPAFTAISMTEASARGIARLAREAAEGSPAVIARHKRPVAIVLGHEEYQRLLEAASRSAVRQRPGILGPPQG
jgi:PHD/YefM family antitoxin component YafN of YafNO toxin-antitoxin module